MDINEMHDPLPVEASCFFVSFLFLLSFHQEILPIDVLSFPTTTLSTGIAIHTK